MRETRPRALQAVRANVPGMRSRLPDGRGILLEVGPAEAIDALVVAKWIEHAKVQLERLSDPLSQGRVISEVVVSQRVDQRPQARGFDCRHDRRPSTFEKMD